MMKKILKPPLAPVAVLVGASLLVAIANRVSPDIINEQPDNAPGRATIILLGMTPLFYLLFVIINVIDLLIERATARLPWFSTLIVTLVFSMYLFNIFFRPEIDAATSLAPVALGSLLGAAILIVPMSVWRRRIGTSKNTEAV